MRWFKKPLVLKFYTTNKGVFESAKPKPAGNFLPDWWKKLPKETREVKNFELLQLNMHANMRGCVGMKLMYQHGIVIPLWCDLYFEIGKIGETEFQFAAADRDTNVELHPPTQHNAYWDNSLYQHIKIISPWRVVCDEVVPFLFIDPYWHRNTQNRYSIPPGIVEYKYQYVTNVNMFFNRSTESYSLLLKHGEPLVQLIPLVDRLIKTETHLVSQEEFNRISNYKPSFSNAYKYNRIAIEKENK